MWRLHGHDGQLHADSAKGGGVRGRLGRVSGVDDMAGEQYLGRVAADVGAVLVEHVALVAELLGRAANEIPVLRKRAVVRSVRFSPLPPMQIGGCGCWIGLGSQRASVSW